SLLGLSLTLVIFSSSVNTTLAAKTDEKYTFAKKDGKEALYDNANKVFIVDAWTADGKKLSLTEYKIILENSERARNDASLNFSNSELNQSRKNIINTINPLNILVMNYYENDLSWAATGTPEKVTPSVDCPSWQPAACQVQVQYAIQTTESFSVNVDAGDKNYIRGNAGFSWSTSSQSQVGATYQIPQGDRGYITFAPWINYTRGYIHYAYSDQTGYHYLGKSDMKFANAPKKLPNGFTDGVFSVVKY
ncbi:hypothetical protein, partial [Paenibacillus chitinolyticus]|uniref:hypothetical protein n=1 Tax=Paenibacillus chitinolyticus TaxID=79263 RepID=UPI00367036DE